MIKNENNEDTATNKKWKWMNWKSEQYLRVAAELCVVEGGSPRVVIRLGGGEGTETGGSLRWVLRSERLEQWKKQSITTEEEGMIDEKSDTSRSRQALINASGTLISYERPWLASIQFDNMSLMEN